MEKQFIPYEQALDLKDLVFDECCFKIYYTKDRTLEEIHIGVDTICNTDLEKHPYGDGYISAPLYQQAFKFFRDCEFDFAIFEKYKDLGKFYGGYTRRHDSAFGKSFGSNFKTYEEAEQACLEKLIEIVKKK